MGNRRLCLLKVLAMWVWSYKYWLGSDEIMLKFFNFWNERKKTKKETDRMRERETLERGSVSSLQYKDWNFSFCVNYIGENATDIFLLILFFLLCGEERGREMGISLRVWVSKVLCFGGSPFSLPKMFFVPLLFLYYYLPTNLLWFFIVGITLIISPQIPNLLLFGIIILITKYIY